MNLPSALIDDFVNRALHEDLGESGDVTTQLCLVAACQGKARIIARAMGVVAGLPLAVQSFRAQDPGVQIELCVAEGDRVVDGQDLLTLRGTAAGMLAAERTALNFLQRLSGIATVTRRYVDAVAGTETVILDTRKTVPTLRSLDKYAVRVGGGQNHRQGLYDQVLIKENHFALAAPSSYAETVARAVAGSDRPVIAEARSHAEAQTAVQAGADLVLLDNFAAGQELRSLVRELRALAESLGRSVLIEASGGIDLGRVRSFADCGVDRISVGALTHSVIALDLSMLVEGSRG